MPRLGWICFWPVLGCSRYCNSAARDEHIKLFWTQTVRNPIWGMLMKFHHPGLVSSWTCPILSAMWQSRMSADTLNRNACSEDSALVRFLEIKTPIVVPLVGKELRWWHCNFQAKRKRLPLLSRSFPIAEIRKASNGFMTAEDMLTAVEPPNQLLWSYAAASDGRRIPV